MGPLRQPRVRSTEGLPAPSPTALQTADTALLVLYEAPSAWESLVYLCPPLTRVLLPLNSVPCSLAVLLVHYNICVSSKWAGFHFHKRPRTDRNILKMNAQNKETMVLG